MSTDAADVIFVRAAGGRLVREVEVVGVEADVSLGTCTLMCWFQAAAPRYVFGSPARPVHRVCTQPGFQRARMSKTSHAPGRPQSSPAGSAHMSPTRTAQNIRPMATAAARGPTRPRRQVIVDQHRHPLGDYGLRRQPPDSQPSLEWYATSVPLKVRRDSAPHIGQTWSSEGAVSLEASRARPPLFGGRALPRRGRRVIRRDPHYPVESR